MSKQKKGLTPASEETTETVSIVNTGFVSTDVAGDVVGDPSAAVSESPESPESPARAPMGKKHLFGKYRN